MSYTDHLDAASDDSIQVGSSTFTKEWLHLPSPGRYAET